jgi:hypothetical protein
MAFYCIFMYFVNLTVGLYDYLMRYKRMTWKLLVLEECVDKSFVEDDDIYIYIYR